jgi:cytochrome oxidase Cu insertion factor (SCO1/SenC/PrrC family)
MSSFYHKVAGLLIAGFVLTSAACSSREKQPDQQKQTAEAQVSDLPDITLAMMDGSKLQVKTLKGNAILILFQPDCDHCQREAEDIKDFLKEFEKYTLYFIAAADMKEIKAFASTYGLADKPNIRFGATDVTTVVNSFGSIPAPSVFIYNGGKQKAAFKGETEIGQIIRAL